MKSLNVLVLMCQRTRWMWLYSVGRLTGTRGMYKKGVDTARLLFRVTAIARGG